MEVSELQTRLIEDARRYDPAVQGRTLLGPHRDALLMYRVKFLSYEQIAAALLRNGLRVSAAAVGVYCRRNFTKAEILRERRRLETDSRRTTALPAHATFPTGEAPPRPSAPLVSGKRGPKIARDDF